MKIQLTFLGGTQNVTGSRYLLEAHGQRVLIDCGLYQERRLRDRNWHNFGFAPDSLDAVLLTHAHLDHCGLLPRLVKEGFRGRVLCTPATAEIAEVILLDAGRLQEEDAEYKAKRHRREGRGNGVEPLYTVEDAARASDRFKPVGYGREVKVAKGIHAIFHNAGHVFGASSIEVVVERNGETRRIVFSGDVGRPDMPIVRDPDRIAQADYVLIESTYGDREHPPTKDTEAELGEIINQTHQAGGNVIIPAFALERSQDLLYHLNELRVTKRTPPLMVFLDSPMAIRITEAFRRHPELFDEEMARRVAQHRSPFDMPNLKMTLSSEESKTINQIRGTVIVIAGSGMCTGGRIKHHLANNIERPESTILFVGYQAADTLGRHIVDGAKQVRIFGETRAVNARIARLNGFSAHADRNELLAWLGTLETAPRQIFAVHGETDAAKAFAGFVGQKTGWPTVAPEYGQTVTLD